MKTVLLFTPLLLLLLACAKDESFTEDYRNDSISWLIGAEHSLDTTMVVPESSSDNASIAVESFSICPSSDLKITVASGSEVLLDTIYHDGDAAYQIPGSKGKELSVHSRLVDNGSLVLCVWLGQAALKYNYFE